MRRPCLSISILYKEKKAERAKTVISKECEIRCFKSRKLDRKARSIPKRMSEPTFAEMNSGATSSPRGDYESFVDIDMSKRKTLSLADISTIEIVRTGHPLHRQRGNSFHSYMYLMFRISGQIYYLFVRLQTMATKRVQKDGR